MDPSNATTEQKASAYDYLREFRATNPHARIDHQTMQRALRVGEPDGGDDTITRGCRTVSSLHHVEKVACNNCGQTSVKGRGEVFDCPHCPGGA